MKLFILTVLVANWILAQAQPPTLLSNALRRLPGVVLLDPSRDLPGGYTVKESNDFGYWPPWVVTDLARRQEFWGFAEVLSRRDGILLNFLDQKRSKDG